MTASVAPASSILLIDDRPALLDEMQEHLAAALGAEHVEIRQWVPERDSTDTPIRETFDALIVPGTTLVVTDHDLTQKGATGLFGSTIVSWCQQKLIPVGDFSRGNNPTLPREPNLFELRVPTTPRDGATFVATAFRGFTEIARAVGDPKHDAASAQTSPAAALAAVLGRPHLGYAFALYMSRLGAANGALVERIRALVAGTVPEPAEKARLLTYVLGHVLLNAVLRFPGPILSVPALCAYVGTSETEAGPLQRVFKKARYMGPFGADAAYFWREQVDEIINRKGAQLSDSGIDDFGSFNRAAVEAAVKRDLAPHGCDREGCGGKRGGFWCPFTRRAVCLRADCSVPSSSWIPEGAEVARVERVFHDEWAPLLGR